MRGATPVDLPSRALDALILLIEHRNRCVDKEELIAAIWDDVIVTDDSLTHAISVLRRALGDERRHSRYIQTLPRRGYRFIAEVRPVDSADSGERAAATPSSLTASTALPNQPHPEAASARPAAARARIRWPWNVGIAGGAALMLAAAVLVLGRDADAPDSAGASIRLFQPAPPDSRVVSGGMLSPDGRYLAFVARDEARGETTLWLRALQTEELRRLPGTEGASKPFWAPDSRRLAFFAEGQLIVIEIADGSRRSIAPVFAAAGGTWSSDDTILYAEWANGLYAVPGTGDGPVSKIAELDRGAEDIAFGWPQFFPDGRQYLYQVVSLDAERSGIYVGNLDTGRQFKLLSTSSSATLAPPHHVLHVENDMLIAEELDPARAELTGRAIVVARGVSAPSLAGENIVSASAGLLAFQHGVVRQSLAWFDRNGAPLGTVPIPTGLFNTRISPDGSMVAGSGSLTTDPGLWLVRLDREETTRLETDAMAPVWSSDSSELAFASRNGHSVFVRSMHGTEGKRLIASDDTVKILNDWSPDGRLLVLTKQGAETGLDLWTLDVGTGESRPLLATAHGETQARISPDGQWIAYASDESGSLEIYVARFPGMQEPRQVSAAGGGQPQWRADQGELFYLSPEHSVMAIDIGSDGPTPAAAPRRLFHAAVAGDPGDGRDFFAPDADGSRFLIDSSANDNAGQAITIMVNWAAGQSEQLALERSARGTR